MKILTYWQKSKVHEMQVHVHRSAVVTWAGAGGKYSLPQILADHVTLSQSGGKICPTHYDSPHGFSELPTALHR